MTSFFKKKVTATEMAKGFTQLTMTSLSEDAQSFLGEVEDDIEVDQTTLSESLLYLRIFLVDFFTEMALKNNPRKKECVLNAYYSEMYRICNAQQSNYEQKLKAHVATYMEALRTQHPRGPAWVIGKAYAELCNAGMDIAIILFAGDQYSFYLKSITDLIKSFRLVD